MVRVKICGLTRAEDVAAAVAAGADALGFNFWRGGPRYIEPHEVASIIPTVPPTILTVSVFVDETAETVRAIAEQTGVRALQLHGTEAPEYLDRLGDFFIIKALKVSAAFRPEQLRAFRSATLFLLDGFVAGMHGGTGQSFDWSLAEQAKAYGKIILAGGLTPENVTEAVRRVRPWGVDVASGVELQPGVKNARLIREFIQAARAVDTQGRGSDATARSASAIRGS